MENQTEFNVTGKTGGEKTHTLTVSEMPRHRHTMYNPNTGGNPLPSDVEYSVTINSGNAFERQLMSNTGGGQPHNNLQPYYVAYIWKLVSYSN